MCDRVAVMYLGKIVELASSDAALRATRGMPYTGALMSAVPVADPRLAAAKKRQILAGDVPSPTNPPPACRFHTRCWKAQEICRQDEPPLEAKDGGNIAACHFPLTDAEVLERVPTSAARLSARRSLPEPRCAPAAWRSRRACCPTPRGPRPRPPRRSGPRSARS